MKRIVLSFFVLALLIVSSQVEARMLYDVIEIKHDSYDYVSASDINNNGVVTGNLCCNGEGMPAYRWKEGQGFVPLELIENGDYSRGKAVNDYNIVAGYGNTSYSEGYVAFISYWNTTTVLPLHPGDSASEAHAINDSGVVAGVVLSGITRRAVYWDDNHVLENVNNILGGPESLAYGINNNNEIVGWAHDATGSQRAFFVNTNTTQNMEDIGSLDGGAQAYAKAINDSSVVVGYSEKEETGMNAHYGFVWDAENGMREICDNLGYNSHVRAINNQGVAVGEFVDENYYPYACIWDEVHGSRNINDLIDSNSEYHIGGCYGINDLGEIVCAASKDEEGVEVLLTPHRDPVKRSYRFQELPSGGDLR